MPKKIKTILYIKLNSFFPSVETSLNPLLKNKPVLVTNGFEKNDRVISLNLPAQQNGISQQMQIDKALKLLPEAVMVRGSINKYRNFSNEFYKILSIYSDVIEPVSLDEAYIEMVGYEHKWISPESMANDIRKKIYNELEISSTIGIADNKICAMVAAMSSRPNSIFYVARGQEKFFLKNKALTYLPTIGPRTEKFLKQMDINNIGDFAQLPLNMVISSFGDNGKYLWQLANGLDYRKLNSPTNKKSMTKSVGFSFATRDLDFLSNELLNLSYTLWQKLNLTHKQSNTISIKIIDQSGEIKTKQKKLYGPINSNKELFEICKNLLIHLITSETNISNLGITLFNISSKNRKNNTFGTSFIKLKEIQKSLIKLSYQFGINTKQIQMAN